MTGYLDRIGAGNIIRDHAPLTFDHIPDGLVGRDAELTKLGEIFSGIATGANVPISHSWKSNVTTPSSSRGTAFSGRGSRRTRPCSWIRSTSSWSA